MKLTVDQIRAVTRGAVHVQEEAGLIRFYRFTEAQSRAYYDAGNMNFHTKTYASAGVRLAFTGNTEHFSFAFEPHMASSRQWFSIDVRVNGRITAHREYDSNEDPTRFRFETTFAAGEKQIEVYLPFSARVDLYDVEIDDHATISPIRRAHTMYEFGDSITHGYDGHYPSLSYANRLAVMLDADPVNKGIGGDIFFPALLDEGGDAYEHPDYITVAYGVNDWANCERETVEKNCRAFYVALSKRYPDAKIFAITPIWCTFAGKSPEKFGAPLREMDRLIGDRVKDLPNVTLICGDDLVPHTPDFFIPDGLHPNDFGFCLYGENLCEEIKKHL